MAKIEDLFDVVYGVNLEFNKMTPNQKGIPFVARGASNNGVVGFVEIIDGIAPNPGNTISVAGGGSVLESFYQEQPYYSGRDLYYLRPKQELSRRQMLFYCLSIRSNKWRYSYGRQANKTLREIKVPSLDQIPNWVESIVEVEPPDDRPYHVKAVSLSDRIWASFELGDLFNIEYGVNLELNRMTLDETGIPFVSRTSVNNGVSAHVKLIEGISPNPANSISISGGGSVLEAFIQDSQYYSGRDLFYLTSKTELSKFMMVFVCTLIRLEKFRYNYGRQANKSLKTLKIKLPVDNTGEPDWAFMEYYIKSLPYSKNLEQIDTQVRKREKPLALKGDLDDILGLAVSKPKKK